MNYIPTIKQAAETISKHYLLGNMRAQIKPENLGKLGILTASVIAGAKILLETEENKATINAEQGGKKQETVFEYNDNGLQSAHSTYNYDDKEGKKLYKEIYDIQTNKETSDKAVINYANAPISESTQQNIDIINSTIAQMHGYKSFNTEYDSENLSQYGPKTTGKLMPAIYNLLNFLFPNSDISKSGTIRVKEKFNERTKTTIVGFEGAELPLKGLVTVSGDTLTYHIDTPEMTVIGENQKGTTSSYVAHLKQTQNNQQKNIISEQPSENTTVATEQQNTTTTDMPATTSKRLSHEEKMEKAKEYIIQCIDNNIPSAQMHAHASYSSDTLKQALKYGEIPTATDGAKVLKLYLAGNTVEQIKQKMKEINIDVTDNEINFVITHQDKLFYNSRFKKTQATATTQENTKEQTQDTTTKNETDNTKRGRQKSGKTQDKLIEKELLKQQKIENALNKAIETKQNPESIRTQEYYINQVTDTLLEDLKPEEKDNKIAYILTQALLDRYENLYNILNIASNNGMSASKKNEYVKKTRELVTNENIQAPTLTDEEIAEEIIDKYVYQPQSTNDNLEVALQLLFAKPNCNLFKKHNILGALKDDLQTFFQQQYDKTVWEKIKEKMKLTNEKTLIDSCNLVDTEYYEEDALKFLDKATKLIQQIPQSEYQKCDEYRKRLSQIMSDVKKENNIKKLQTQINDFKSLIAELKQFLYRSNNEIPMPDSIEQLNADGMEFVTPYNKLSAKNRKLIKKLIDLRNSTKIKRYKINLSTDDIGNLLTDIGFTQNKTSSDHVIFSSKFVFLSNESGKPSNKISFTYANKNADPNAIKEIADLCEQLYGKDIL